ncbi:AraC family transcriptional regulator [Paraburkholderia madseniana]|uniref:AraC family transcriptional regulator n=1 Tax=Paraburkholderia madseniana TaxID=2599607 RepID=UPI001558D571|nr:AraC family transcriptional regulator [Paraburkholderia madseniana]NPT69299.1 helix-turn-helix domain-containing protein [Paraburkholderia madseniana]
MRQGKYLESDFEVEMSHDSSVKVWRMTDLHDAEMLKGTYVQHMYPWHSHEEISLGLVLEGAIDLRTRSHQGIAKAGSFTLINAEEAHYGTPVNGGGWRCRTIHINPRMVHNTAADLRRYSPASSIAFLGPTFDDPDAARELLELHRRSEAETSALERQSRLVTLIVRLLLRHSEAMATVPARVREPRAVELARDYLVENLGDKVTLEELAATSGVPPFRLLRAFQQSVGLTPHAYQTQTRIREACQMLRSRQPLADIAITTGFADQAHLTRTFKAIMGMTPGQYRDAFR